MIEESGDFTLYGDRFTPPYPNSGLGSKFIVVFGELTVYENLICARR